jgi:hypothetical protein
MWCHEIDRVSHHCLETPSAQIIAFQLKVRRDAVIRRLSVSRLAHRSVLPVLSDVEGSETNSGETLRTPEGAFLDHSVRIIG